MEKQDQKNKRINEQGYEKAVDLLYQCAGEDGFFASPTKTANYRRIWSAAGAIIGEKALAGQRLFRIGDRK